MEIAYCVKIYFIDFHTISFKQEDNFVKYSHLIQ